jgi:1-deoxy-D-xylulose-5-phosphate reductoisomerase
VVTPPLSSDAPRRISILGATGSIGASTLAVIAERPADFSVVAVTGNDNAAKLAEIARDGGAELAVIANPAAYAALKDALAGTGIEAATGNAAVIDAASRPTDLVIAAIVGAAGLAPTMAAIEAGTQVALANKECLVCAGDLFVGAARKAGMPILPVDSEHNAIFQALGGHPIETVEKIILTASGGPFRDWTVEAMAAASPQQALRHPNWSMGQKITIDSATMMNKGLEVIEAHHLFGLPDERVEILVHPQSAVHGIVAFRDGSMLAQISAPDMRTPIAHCLAWPERTSSGSTRLDLAALGTLSFERPDPRRFPALRLAREALAAGGWATNIMNAANEIAVEAFLRHRIGFLEIAELVEETVERAAGLSTKTPDSTEAALDLDREGRRIALELMEHRAGLGIAS